MATTGWSLGIGAVGIIRCAEVSWSADHIRVVVLVVLIY